MLNFHPLNRNVTAYGKQELAHIPRFKFKPAYISQVNCCSLYNSLKNSVVMCMIL